MGKKLNYIDSHADLNWQLLKLELCLASAAMMRQEKREGRGKMQPSSLTF